jgi:hypothetical protein
MSPPMASPPPRPRRRLSPQQVLLSLGALLVVAGALALVARGWTRYGLAFQAAAIVTATAAACTTSAWAARRQLRATEEALAAAGTALLAIGLGAAHARGLGGLDDVPLRTWTAVSCLVVLAVALGLNRLTRSTTTWPLAAVLAAQPVPVLLLPNDLLSSPVGLATALLVAGADLAAVPLLRRSLQRLLRVLAALWAAAGALGGLLLAGTGSAAESWTATGLLLAAGAAAVAVLRLPRLTGGRLRTELVAAGAGAVGGLALTASLGTIGEPGPVVASGLGLLLLTAAALVSGPAPLAGPLPRPAVPAVRAALQAGGTALAAAGALVLADDLRYGPLSLLALAATVPAALTAVRVPGVREVATGGALLAPALAVLLALEDDRLTSPAAGLLLALLAAGGFALATARAGAQEEWVCAGAAGATGLIAGITTSDAGAWGQVGLQLAVVGVAAGSYALVARRPLVAVVAVADLVVASWIAVAGAGVETAEAYTLPAAIGLLVVAWPRLRVGAPSWAAEGAAVGVALVPSTLALVASPTALRLVLVVAGAVAVVALGTLLHRQAPFVLGAGALAFVVATQLGRYAPLVPIWVVLPVVLPVAGVALFVLGSTYERRLKQAREAVAWVAQMS